MCVKLHCAMLRDDETCSYRGDRDHSIARIRCMHDKSRHVIAEIGEPHALERAIFYQVR